MSKIEIHNLCFSYPNSAKLFQDFNLILEGQNLHFLLGANGSGKTSLIKLILGTLKQSSGVIRFDDNKGTGFDHRAALIGYVPQNYSLDGEMNVIDSIHLISSLHNQNGSKSSLIKQQVIDNLGITSLLNKRIKFLSGGQKQLVNISLALLHNPTIIILDEPFVGLDYANTSKIISVIKSLGKTVICITHDIALAEYHSDTIVLLRNGKLEVSDTPTDIVKNNPYNLLELDFKPLSQINYEAIEEMQYTQQKDRLILSFKDKERPQQRVDNFLVANESSIASTKSYKNSLRASLVGAYNFTFEIDKKTKTRGQGTGGGGGNGQGKNKHL